MSNLTAVMNPTSRLVQPLPATKNLALRKSVYDLSDDEVRAFRKAVAGIMAFNDNRGWQHVASQHGHKEYYCPHGNPMFAIWHRPYMIMMEQALQRIIPGFGLPYWDWTSERAATEGLPSIFTEATYVDEAGNTVPNPLLSAKILPGANVPAETTRAPGAPAALATTRALVAEALRKESYDTFTAALEQPHNFVHGWVGGSMGAVPTAAYDPVFWVHHSMVEKIFCDWQNLARRSIPASVGGRTLVPFAVRSEDVWDYSTLGYRYQGPAAAVQVVPPGGEPGNRALVARFALGSIAPDFKTARLGFHESSATDTSCEIRIFFNHPGADESTPTAGHPGFVRSIYTFGHGTCTGDDGHCVPPGLPEDATQWLLLRGKHHRSGNRMFVDVTDALRPLVGVVPAVEVSMVAVRPDGRRLPGRGMTFDLLTLDAV